MKHKDNKNLKTGGSQETPYGESLQGKELLSGKLLKHKSFGWESGSFSNFLRDEYQNFSANINRRNQQIVLTAYDKIAPDQIAEKEVRERLAHIRESTDLETMPINSGEPLPFSLRNRYEPQMGIDFSAVRLHTDPLSAQFAKQQRAHAVTIKHHIIGDPEKLNLEKSIGRALLGHELTHVAQQAHLSKEQVLSPSNHNKLENEALMQEQRALSMEKKIFPKNTSTENKTSNLERQHFIPPTVLPDSSKSKSVVNSIVDAAPMAAAIDRTLPEIPKENYSRNQSEITQQLYADLKLKLQTEKERSGA